MLPDSLELVNRYGTLKVLVFYLSNMCTEKDAAANSKAITHISTFLLSFGSCLLEISVLGHHSHLKAGVCSLVVLCSLVLKVLCGPEAPLLFLRSLAVLKQRVYANVW